MSATAIIWLPVMFLLYKKSGFFKPDSSRPFLNHLPDSEGGTPSAYRAFFRVARLCFASFLTQNCAMTGQSSSPLLLSLGLSLSPLLSAVILFSHTKSSRCMAAFSLVQGINLMFTSTLRAARASFVSAPSVLRVILNERV